MASWLECFNKLNHILSLKNQLKEMKMNKGEYVQSYIMRVFCLRDQLQFVGEQISDRELVVVTLQGLLLFGKFSLLL